MATDLDAIAGVVQVFFDGKYEGTLADFSVDDNRAVTMTGTADGTNHAAVGIAKPTINFSRPTLKTPTQLPPDYFDGPLDMEIVIPQSARRWRVEGFRRATFGLQHNPDAGNTSERYSGPAKKLYRTK